ncbi:hypothetical protein, partial [Paracoccus thiocyanatus]|uniref:hypothetical protein n=1 Tax=Paracoccus thiocyanatus TaxID=34006 RepID=UPI001C6DE50B
MPLDPARRDAFAARGRIQGGDQIAIAPRLGIGGIGVKHGIEIGHGQRIVPDRRQAEPAVIGLPPPRGGQRRIRLGIAAGAIKRHAPLGRVREQRRGKARQAGDQQKPPQRLRPGQRQAGQPGGKRQRPFSCLSPKARQ